MNTRYPVDQVRSYSVALLPDGTRIEANSKAQLARMVGDYLHGSGQLGAVKNFDAFLANAICAALPEERAAVECRYVDEDAPEGLRAARVIRLDDLWRGLASIKQWLAGGLQLVPIEEANRRASICAQCPLNRSAAGFCAPCVGLVGRVAEVIGDRRTPYDPFLNVCDVCACSLKAAVHAPLEAQEREGLDFPAYCWKRTAE